MTESTRGEYDFGGAINNSYPSRQKEHCLELAAWQIKEIKQALKEADAGEFVPAEDIAKAVKKYAVDRYPAIPSVNWR